MSQLDLITGESEPDQGGGVTLTPRQALALQYIAAHQPVSGDEIGALLHQDRQARGGKGHPADERCEWCQTEGKDMGDALRRRGLVVRKHAAGWCLPDYRTTTSGSQDGHDPATAPLPEGF